MQDKDLIGNGKNNDELIDNILKETSDTSIENHESEAVEDAEDIALPSEEISEENFEEETEIEITEEIVTDDQLLKKHQIGKAKTKRKIRSKKSKTSKWISVMVRITFIVCASTVLSVFLISLGREYLGINKSDDIVDVKIEEGATTYDIAQLLYEKNVIKSPSLFRLISKLKKADSAYMAGEHIIKPNMGYDMMIYELTSEPLNEEYETVSITFNEGVNLYDVSQQLLESGVIEDSDRFLFLFNSRAFLDPDKYSFASMLPEPNEMKFYQMEGYFFPDTYTFYVGVEDSDDADLSYKMVCEKIYDNFESKIKEYYKKISSMNYNLDQIITLASIVQSEAPAHESMKNVASVFYNRLSNPEAIGRTQAFLESDPTTKYANEVIRPNIENTAASELIIQAYDTYNVAGLTPGAICNPGIDAIKAVINSETTEYYYFCANINTKETYFAKTIEEHDANLAMVEEQYAESAASAEEAASVEE